MKLTKRTVDALEPGPKDLIVFDEMVSGFGLRISPAGRKTFLVQYRRGGRTRRVKIGGAGQIAPDEARKIAKRLLGEIASGQNPA
ncbi:MAG: Arm DNA-binding domain-containing protein, partial [Pseudomonadota bacterium]